MLVGILAVHLLLGQSELPTNFITILPNHEYLNNIALHHSFPGSPTREQKLGGAWERGYQYRSTVEDTFGNVQMMSMNCSKV